MELYLHVGTNKTASSFLQSTLTINSKLLEKHGVYLPPSKWDAAMKTGVITPGNGHELAKLLAKEENLSLIKYLKGISKEAQNRGLQKICLSNEIIIRLFSNKSILVNLERALKESGFEQVFVIAFFRNPYQHALSLCKHRLKSGQDISYREWLFSDYETLRVNDLFLEHYKSFPFKWEFKVYKKDTDYMMGAFFKEFLHIDEKIHLPEREKINSSLRLRSIAVLQVFEKRNSDVQKYLYDCLIESKFNNYEDKRLLLEFYKECHHYFKNYSQTLQGLSELLENDAEKTIFLETPSLSENDYKNESPYDIDVFEAIANALEKYDNDKIEIFLKKIYGLARNTLRIKKNFDSERYGGSLRL